MCKDFIKPLITPTWEAKFTLNVETKKKEGDVFALWYLVTDPKTNHAYRKSMDDFGYLSKFNGVGIFVYKDKEQWYLHAL